MKLLKFGMSMSLVMALSACSTLDTGSMRIDVEVYNGPLSKTLEVQQAELLGTLAVTQETMALLIREFHLSQCRLGCYGKKWRKGNAALDDASTLCNVEQAEHIHAPDVLHGTLAKLKKSTAFTRENSSLDRLEIENLFPEHLLRQYPQMFPLIKRYKWLDFLPLKDYPQEKGGKIPTQKEDFLHRVCPVLGDVKHNLLASLNYSFVPLENNQIGKAERNTLLDCQSKLDKQAKAIRNASETGQNPPDLIDAGALECVTKIAKFGKILREGAEHWATTQMAIMPRSKRTRIVVARASITAAEMGNELVARADAIMHQYYGKKRTDLLKNSLYLRDSEATDYLNLVDWLDAYPRREAKWKPADRTRMIERLVTDANWSKVNTAYTHGRGKASMVFVKDNIGNWNLKSYKNDPGELLAGYRDAGTTVLDTAVRLAEKSTSVGQLSSALAGVTQSSQVANQLILGTASQPAPVVAPLADSSEQQFKRIMLDVDGKVAELKQQLEAHQERDGEIEQTLKSAKQSQEAAQQTFNSTQSEQQLAQTDVVQQQALLEYLQAQSADSQVLIKQTEELAKLNKTLLEVKLKHSESAGSLALAQGQLDQAQAAQDAQQQKTENLQQQIKNAPVVALALIEQVVKQYQQSVDVLTSQQGQTLPGAD